VKTPGVNAFYVIRPANGSDLFYGSRDPHGSQTCKVREEIVFGAVHISDCG